MNRCEAYQGQLLDHIYGLLDEAERTALAEHLQGCAACGAALAVAESQRLLLAEAARAKFPAVRFEPPVLPGLELRPASVKLLQPEPARRPWRRWAVAAAVLLAVAGVAAAGGLSWHHHREEYLLAQARFEQAKREHDERAHTRRSDIERAEQEVREVQDEILKLEREWKGKLSQAEKEAADKEMKITVVGPRTIEAGARNDYHIETRKPLPSAAPGAAPPAPARLDARVVDAATRKVYFHQSLVSKGDCLLTLPPDLPVKPNTQLTLEVVARADSGAEAKVTERLPLVGTLYLTHLCTDRPMYRPGEVVHFRSLTLERFSLRPAQEDFQLAYTITDGTGAKVFELVGKAVLTQGKGQAPLRGPDGKELRGIGAGEFRLPPTAAGGDYTLTVADAQGRFPSEQRHFLVNRYQAPRLNKELEFTRKSYGPGALVEASCKVAFAENREKPVANQPVIATAQVDGKPLEVDNAKGLRTDAQGNVPPIRFHLPAQMERGVGTLAVQFTDGANHETIVRPIPIVLKKLFVDFYPEGGDLVLGVPNRVYFQARTNVNKPAELQGRVVDQTGAVAASAKTLSDDKERGANQGMGLFQFTPQAGKTYELKIDAPAGIEGRYPLPKVQPDGVVLAIPAGVVTDKIDATLYTGRTQRSLLVGAYCRGRVLQHRRVLVKPGTPAHVTLTPTEEAGGVYRVTVFEERGAADRPQLVPVAERLIYRRPARHLDLTIRTDKKSYSPGAPVRVTFKAKDESGKPAASVLLASVVDLGLLKLVDDKTARSMPTHFLLTTEIKKPEDLEYADFLLSDHPKAEAALDLLLGTQGWRRFAEQDPAQFRQKEKGEADRLLLATGSSPTIHDSLQSGLVRVDQKYTPLWEGKQQELARKETNDEQKKQAGQEELTRLQTAVVSAQRQARSAETEYEEHTDWLINVSLAGLLCLLLAFGVCGVVTGLVRFARAEGRARPFMLTGVCSLALSLLVVVLVARLGQGTVEDRIVQLAKARRAGPETARLPGARRAGVVGTTERQVAVEGLEVPTDNEVGAAPPVPTAALAPPPGIQPAADEGTLHARLEEKGKFADEPMKDARRLDDKGDVKEQLADRDDAVKRWLLQPPRGEAATAAVTAGAQPQGKELANGGALGLGRPAAGLMGPPGTPPFNFQPAGPGGLPGQAANFNGGIGGFGGIQGGQGGGQFGPVAGNFGGGMAGNLPGQVQFGLQGLNNPALERQLRQRGQWNDIAALRMKRAIPAPPALEPLVVREYAHKHQPAADGTRQDFADTLCWQPVLVLPQGTGQVSFDLPDTVTRFQVVAWGHTLDGRLGAVTSEFASRLPFSLEPVVPTEITNTDKVIIPLTIANDTDTPRSVKVDVSASNLKLEGQSRLSVSVGAEQRLRKLFTFRPDKAEGEAKVVFNGRCEPFGTDRILGKFNIVHEGFPFVGSKSDLLEGGVAQQTITLPEGWIQGTLKLQAQAFPSTLADLQKGLEAMLREPGGCFEQTSSSNYPNVLILSYLKESEQARPEIEKQARRLLESGYQKLTSFECQDPKQPRRRGYEWFGGTAPPHEALTAYGLLEFRDMAKVRPVDPAMLERTRKYLLAQRDGKGGFRRNPQAVDSFGRAPDHITNAYIVWALTESGAKDNLDAELDVLTKQAKDAKDPYFLALVGNSLVGRGRTKDGLEVLHRLGTMQKADGHLEGAQTSITSSGGRDLEIETTALATLAWLKANRPADFNDNVLKAARWIGKQRGGFGGFGSTQATILALKALIAFTRENRRPAAAGELRLFVNDSKEPVAVKPFAAGTQEALVVTLLNADLLRPGKNTVRVELTGKNSFPYTVTWSYNTLKPANPEGCPVHLAATLDRASAMQGETVRLKATVQNKSGKGQGMAVAILGLPGGLTLPEDMKQLKEMARLRDNDTKPGLISAWEIRGRELVLYWRGLAPDQKIDVSVDLICRVPGDYRGPASRAYLYYNADRKFWTEPLRIAIEPRGE